MLALGPARGPEKSPSGRVRKGWCPCLMAKPGSPGADPTSSSGGPAPGEAVRGTTTLPITRISGCLVGLLYMEVLFLVVRLCAPASALHPTSWGPVVAPGRVVES